MNKTGKASEPSMDEILASIRRIIAEEPAWVGEAVSATIRLRVETACAEGAVVVVTSASASMVRAVRTSVKST